MYSLVIVHEDGAVSSIIDIPEAIGRHRFEKAAGMHSVVFARLSCDGRSDLTRQYVREG